MTPSSTAALYENAGPHRGADMSDYTPEEIEAAAKAIHDTVEAQCVKAGMRLTWGSKQQDPTTRECYREQARAALAAADNDARVRGIARVDTQNEATIEQARLEADLTVAVHEATVARARVAGHYCGGRDKEAK